MTEHVDGIVVIHEKTQQYLNERQLVDYRTHREQLIQWTLTLGKDPEKAEVYADETARQRSYRLVRFYRCVGGRITMATPWRSRPSNSMNF